MRVLIGNTVKTGVADYPCATREEAEALFMALQNRSEPERSRKAEQELSSTKKQAGKKGRN